MNAIDQIILGAVVDPVVKALQERLIKQGYPVGSTGADGLMGANTRDAMLKFRVWAEMNDLDDEQRSLLVAIKGYTAAPTPTPSYSAPSPAPKVSAPASDTLPLDGPSAPRPAWHYVLAGGLVVVGSFGLYLGLKK